jgi:hypothetical protein
MTPFRWQLDTSTTPLPMTLLSTGYKTMSFMSMGNTSMRYTSTGNGRSMAHNYNKFAPQIYGALLLPNIEVCRKFVQICS